MILNPYVKGKKLEYILNDCTATVLVTDQHKLERIKEVVSGCSSLRQIDLCGEKNRGNRDMIQVDNRYSLFEDFLCGEGGSAPPQKRSMEDLAALIYTSGSTGFPKGVMISYRNIHCASGSIIDYIGNTPDDIIMDFLPLSFDYGLFQIFMAFEVGAKVVLERSFAFPSEILKVMERERVTGLPIVPTIGTILSRMKSIASFDLGSLRYITNTAQALPENMILEISEMFPDVALFSMYGLTECKRVSYMDPERLLEKPNSVGRPMKDVETFLIDENGQRIGASDTVGQLVVCGPNVMLGYWNREAETQSVIRRDLHPTERCLLTGDLFKMDPDGDLYFIGRIDDMIKTSGERVSPREIENVIHEMDGISDAAVIAVEDDLLGNAIKAFITSSGSVTEKDVIGHISRRLERFMIPKYVVFLDEMPKNDNGKIDKIRLKEMS